MGESSEYIKKKLIAFYNKNDGQNNIFMKLVEEHNKRSDVEKKILQSSKDFTTNNYQIYDNHNQLFTDVHIIQTSNELLESNESIDMLRVNNVIIKHFKDNTNQLESLSDIVDSIKIELDQIRTKKIYKEKIDYSLRDFSKAIELCKSIKNHFDMSVQNSIELGNMFISLPKIFDNPTAHMNAKPTLERLVSINLKINDLNSKYTAAVGVKGYNNMNQMRNLVNTGRIVNDDKVAIYKWMIDGIDNFRAEIAFLVNIISEKINFLFSVRERYVDYIKVNLLKKRIDATKELENSKLFHLNAHRVESEKIKTLVNHKPSSFSSGYDFHEEMLKNSLATAEYPNSMKSLFDTLKMSKERQIHLDDDQGRISNEKFEEQFDLNLAALKSIQEVMMNQSKESVLQMKFTNEITQLIRLYDLEDSLSTRINFNDSNDNLSTKFELLQSLKLTIYQEPTLQQAREAILDAQFFEIKTELLRLRNMGRVTESEIILLDKIIRILANENGDTTSINHISEQFKYVIRFVPVVESIFNGRRISLPAVVERINEIAIIEMNKRKEMVDYVQKLHEIADMYYKKHEIIIQDHSTVSKSQELMTLFSKLFTLTLKSEIVILETLLRFLMENNLDIGILIDKSKFYDSNNTFYRITTFRDSESVLYKDIIDEIDKKIISALQLDSNVSEVKKQSIYNTFQNIKVRITDLLIDKEEMKSSVKNSLINVFKGTNVTSLTELVAIETKYTDKKIAFIQPEVLNLQMNHYGIYGVLNLLLSTSILIRLLSWKNFNMETLSRLSTGEI